MEFAYNKTINSEGNNNIIMKQVLIYIYKTVFISTPTDKNICKLNKMF